ncbi:MAG: hypothetical protein CTY31_12280 [Hyphomicrobium sp.]|nr:MAG: hypothetical protein CTY31_12280 [Hyphomicrobium sp.]
MTQLDTNINFTEHRADIEKNLSLTFDDVHWDRIISVVHRMLDDVSRPRILRSKALSEARALNRACRSVLHHLKNQGQGDSVDFSYCAPSFERFKTADELRAKIMLDPALWLEVATDCLTSIEEMSDWVLEELESGRTGPLAARTSDFAESGYELASLFSVAGGNLDPHSGRPGFRSFLGYIYGLLEQLAQRNNQITKFTEATFVDAISRKVDTAKLHSLGVDHCLGLLTRT